MNNDIKDFSVFSVNIILSFMIENLDIFTHLIQNFSIILISIYTSYRVVKYFYKRYIQHKKIKNLDDV